MKKDLLCLPDLAAGMSHRAAREEWKSRVRSTRRTAVLQAWDATRRLLGGVGGGERMRRRIEKTADHTEEDPQEQGGCVGGDPGSIYRAAERGLAPSLGGTPVLS